MAIPDWIKKDYIINEVQCPPILDPTNIVCPYESMDVFRDESLFTILIQRQASIYTRCWHLCPSLPPSFAAAHWCHRCELKMNLHPKC